MEGRTNKNDCKLTQFWLTCMDRNRPDLKPNAVPGSSRPPHTYENDTDSRDLGPRTQDPVIKIVIATGIAKHVPKHQTWCVPTDVSSHQQTKDRRPVNLVLDTVSTACLGGGVHKSLV